MRPPREPFNTYSHVFGVVMGLGVAIALTWWSDNNTTRTVGALVFGASMVLSYATSSAYHALHVSEKTLLGLRKLDHASIFVLIAGTYTPVLLVALEPSWRGWALGLVWALALCGVVLKMFTLNAPRWFSTVCYLGLGWLVLLLIPKLHLPPTSWWLLALGGVAYSIGAVVYGFKRPNPWPRTLGFHGLWHVFVLLGSALMFAAVAVLYGNV